MRSLLLSGVALSVLVTPVAAADLAPGFKAPIPIYTWTGCYVGGDIGGGWANQGVLNASQLPFPIIGSQDTVSATATGGTIIGGGHVGCNYQWVPSLVIGVEADFSGTSLNAYGNAESTFAGGELQAAASIGRPSSIRSRPYVDASATRGCRTHCFISPQVAPSGGPASPQPTSLSPAARPARRPRSATRVRVWFWAAAWNGHPGATTGPSEPSISGTASAARRGPDSCLASRPPQRASRGAA
jgi:hypothetical protein